MTLPNQEMRKDQAVALLDTEGAEGKVTRDIDQVAGSKPVNAVSILRHGACLLRGNWRWRTWREIKQTSPH